MDGLAMSIASLSTDMALEKTMTAVGTSYETDHGYQ